MPKKNLLLINSRFLPFVGGGETYVLELLEHFLSLDWKVTVVTATPTSPFRVPDAFKEYIQFIDGFEDSKQIISSCLPQLRTVLDKIQPELIHVHNLLPFYALDSVVEAHEFPIILTVHNTPDIPNRVFGTFNNYRAEYVFTRKLLASASYNKLLVGSRYYLDTYATIAPWILDNQRAEVAYYFPPLLTTQAVTQHTSLPKFKGEVRILFPSRLVKRKGIEDALVALSKLPPNFTLALPSFWSHENKHYAQSLEHLINNLKLRARLVIPPSVTPPQAMSEYYQDADVVLIPSHYEGFGIVALEAMAHKKPVVATAVDGLGEIVRHQKNALVVAPHNPDDICRAVLQLQAESNLKDLLVKNGLAIIKLTFNRQRHMSKIEQIYGKTIRHHS